MRDGRAPVSALCGARDSLVYVLAAFALRTAWRHSPGSPGERRLLAEAWWPCSFVTTASGSVRAKEPILFQRHRLPR